MLTGEKTKTDKIIDYFACQANCMLSLLSGSIKSKLNHFQLGKADDIFGSLHPQHLCLAIIIMIADCLKTNAVLDGVTSFLKYGTLDTSNSDVSTTTWVENTTHQSLRVADMGCKKILQGPLQGCNF